MKKYIDQTVSFVVRFTQKIYQDEGGEEHIQWRGKISHVQGDEQISFTDFQDAMAFMQEKLTKLTMDATDHRSQEEQEGLIMKSYEMWKKMAREGPKRVMEAIKDPKKQVAQIQDQITQVSDEISQKLEIDDWRAATRTDYKQVMGALEDLRRDMATLHKKVDGLNKID